MTLQERLSHEIKLAMLAKQSDRLSALRMLKSALGYLLIERKTETLGDPDFIPLVQREAKKRREAAEQFEKGGRPELAAKEKQELTVLEEFLPKPLSAEELEVLIREAIQESGASEKKQMGQVIKLVQGKAGGRADGRMISEAVGKLLNK